MNGHCLGGGLELASVCDIRMASTAASFVCSGVNVGLMASAYRLPRLIGVARAKHMLLTGVCRRMPQRRRASAWSPPCTRRSTLMEGAITLAQRIASRAPLSVEAVKRNASLATKPVAGRSGALNAGELAVLSRSVDHREALAAFAEKREPKFRRANKPVTRLDRQRGRKHRRELRSLQPHVIAQHPGRDAAEIGGRLQSRS
ncbi:MAG: enoyl-CoA hydratase/isomerase family protein [Rhizomicrobium sp.]